MIKRELKVKYRGTVLGYLWSMLNPLLFMLVISAVFQNIVRGIDQYALYVLSGIVLWNFSSNSIIQSTSSIVANTSLMQKVRIPIWVFVLVPLGANLVNFLLSLVPFLALSLWMGADLPQNFYLFPVVVICFFGFLLGIGVTMAIANVYFRDVSHVLEPVLTLVFYATPIIYDRSGDYMPSRFREVLNFNPFVHFVEVFRSTMFAGASFNPKQLVVLVVLCLLSLTMGAIVFKKFKREIIFRL